VSAAYQCFAALVLLGSVAAGWALLYFLIGRMLDRFFTAIDARRNPRPGYLPLSRPQLGIDTAHHFIPTSTQREASGVRRRPS
jgi:hypothetical protein